MTITLITNNQVFWRSHIRTHFWCESLELPVLQPPEDVLCAVPADAEVEAVHLAEGACPDGRVDELLHDGVPHPQHVRLARLRLGREPRVLRKRWTMSYKRYAMYTVNICINPIL